jgi:Ni2+-binding GTPase involved in maturation of urease and hydrogenase
MSNSRSRSDLPPAVVFVAGFLGSGKTRLLLRAASLLSNSGTRVALITNDQGDDLVDTEWAAERGGDVTGVQGGCFCCRFSDLVDAAERLLARQPQVIFAEPVGSCTDLAATVLRPLQSWYGVQLRVSPLTVLIDPERASEMHKTASDVAYLFQKQMEEADIVCLSKSDLYDAVPELPGISVRRHLSAKTGEGVTAWLDEVLGGTVPTASQALTIDYSRYARAEAALGWLNARVLADLEAPLSPAMLAGPLVDGLDAALTAAGARIAHLKIFDGAPTGSVKIAVCRNGEEPDVEGDLAASPASRHDLVLNLRAEASPELLREIVEAEFARLPRKTEIVNLRAFQPSPPKPQHRIVSSQRT